MKKKNPEIARRTPTILYPTLAALSALLCNAAFPNIDLWPIAWFGLVPLFYTLAKSRLTAAFLCGWLFGFLHMTGLAYWVFNALYFHTSVGFLVSLLFLMLVVGVLLGLYYALFAFGAAKIIQTEQPFYIKALAVASAWVLCESLRAHLFSGIPWDLFGYSQYRWLNFIQIADITGVYGISFVIVFANYCIYEACCSTESVRMCFVKLSPVVVFVLFLLVYGEIRISQFSAKPDTAGHTIAAVQLSILQDDRWKDDQQYRQLSLYLGRTEEAFKKGARLVIWPENALQDYFQEHLPENLIELLARYNANLVTGAPRYTGTTDAYIFYNSAFLLNGAGITQIYDKIHLLPFGEYFPLGFIDVLRLEYSGPREFSPGNRYMVLNTPEGRLGTLICFEIIFPELVRGFVKNGAEILVNISNDAWFGRTSAHYQHFNMAVFRAIEFRRPVVRSANTGISGYIDMAGRIVKRLEPFQEGEIVVSPDKGQGETIYCRYGDILILLCLVIYIAGLFYKKNC